MTLCPYLFPARQANLLKHLLCITNDSLEDLIAKCEDSNLKPLLEKEISKLDKYVGRIAHKRFDLSVLFFSFQRIENLFIEYKVNNRSLFVSGESVQRSMGTTFLAFN